MVGLPFSLISGGPISQKLGKWEKKERGPPEKREREREGPTKKTTNKGRKVGICQATTQKFFFLGGGGACASSICRGFFLLGPKRGAFLKFKREEIQPFFRLAKSSFLAFFWGEMGERGGEREGSAAR